MKSIVKIFIIFCVIDAHSEVFKETIPAYGLIKPARMTNLIAVNNGMVNKITKKVGEKISFGKVALTAIERETTRGYRSTITGHVAKLHVSEGAAVTPGMPLVTIMDPNQKLIEVSFSPQEAAALKVGNSVYRLKSGKKFGTINSLSPLVDPDTGGVISYVQPKGNVPELIGDIIPLKVVSRVIEGCKIINLKDLDQHLSDYSVEATSENKACLLPKKKTLTE